VLLVLRGSSLACDGRVHFPSRLSLATFRNLEQTVQGARSANDKSLNSDPIVDHAACSSNHESIPEPQQRCDALK
jgi:hypothetical protein